MFWSTILQLTRATVEAWASARQAIPQGCRDVVAWSRSSQKRMPVSFRSVSIRHKGVGVRRRCVCLQSPPWKKPPDDSWTFSGAPTPLRIST